ncbi:MAG: serine/threonine protein kinase [Myxococcales bacterium]|nr:serine/threonine protein kinase [Myxococcales bacterium]
MVPFELREGTVFAGDYRVERPLARGGMGAVYVAEQLSTGKRRALKVISTMLVDDDKARERFVQEAKVGALVDSEHVVEVIAAGVDEGTQMPWLAMELLEGETLQQRLEREGRVGPAEMKEIAGQLRHALAIAHAQGIVHRDLKPENLFLERARRAGVPFTVKVLDFGIAKLVQQAKGRTASGTQSLGSPLWMAPEQANAQSVAPSTDVWSLGLVTFAAITGRVYWRTAATDGDLHLTRLLVEILVDPLVPASTRAEQLHARVLPGVAFDRWLERCLDRDPTARFAEAGACLDALIDVLDQADFHDTGRDLGAAVSAVTALATPGAAVDPKSDTAPVDPAVYEPIVRGEAKPEPRPGSGGMGLGQIAALVAGTLLVACMAIFGGILGFSAFSATGAENDEAARPAEPAPNVVTTPDTAQVQRSLTPPTDEPPQPPRVVDPMTTTPTMPTTSPTPRPESLPVFDPRPQGRGPVARSAAGRALYDGTIGPCWRQAPHPATRMEIDIMLAPSGESLSNLRLPGAWQGTPFARCVIGRLDQTRFASRPESTHVVLSLPATH